MKYDTAKLLIVHQNEKMIQHIKNQIYQIGIVVDTICTDNYDEAIKIINADKINCIFISKELFNKKQIKEFSKYLINVNGDINSSLIMLADAIECNSGRNGYDLISCDELSPSIFKRIIENSLIKTDYLLDDHNYSESAIRKLQDNNFLAARDLLTLLPNRKVLLETIASSIQLSKANNSLFAILFIDLDGFKNVNDRAGHQTGDLLLKEVARRLVNITRTTDLVSRHGGDEFVILLSKISNKKDASIVANKVLASLSEPFYINDEGWHISSSIGVAIFPFDGLTQEKIISNADVAMYEAKKLGKNNVQYFNEELNKIAEQKYNVLNDIRKAICNDNFEILLQPQHEINSGKLIGAEVVVRWQHAEKGVIMPKEFLPFIANSGYINAIGDVVLNKALKVYAEYQKYYSEKINIAINIEPRQLANDDFIDFLKSLSDNGQNLEMLTIEFTEACFKNNFKNVKDKLCKLKEIGIKLHLDDFGFGTSSINQLMQIPIDVLKIDKKSLDELPEHDINFKSLNAQKAIIALAHNLGIRVMAKRVDNINDLKGLLEIDCDYAQGYCYSSPLSAKDFYQYVENNKI